MWRNGYDRAVADTKAAAALVETGMLVAMNARMKVAVGTAEQEVDGYHVRIGSTDTIYQNAADAVTALRDAINTVIFARM